MNIKTIRFDRNFYDTTCGTAEAYDCSEQGDHSGEYVRAEDVRELVKQLESAARWIDTSRLDRRFGRDVLNEIRAVLAKHTKGPTT
jgi:arginine/ornithine N-succinyltransferase beta subunit